MEKKLSNYDVCTLMNEYCDFLSSSPSYNKNAKDKNYEALKHFPLFLQTKGYEIWKRD